MKARCVVCGRPYDQILASQKTCSGTCERMRVVTPEPPRSTTAETDWRTCEQDGCSVEFRIEKKRGRPAKKCPQHRRTA